MDQKILSELGDYLLAHREEIIDEWLRAVAQNPDISSFDHLKDKEELLDHLPELCQNLAELLKSPQSDQNRAEVSTCCTSPWQIPLATRVQARGGHTRDEHRPKNYFP